MSSLLPATTETDRKSQLKLELSYDLAWSLRNLLQLLTITTMAVVNKD